MTSYTVIFDNGEKIEGFTDLFKAILAGIGYAKPFKIERNQYQDIDSNKPETNELLKGMIRSLVQIGLPDEIASRNVLELIKRRKSIIICDYNPDGLKNKKR